MTAVALPPRRFASSALPVLGMLVAVSSWGTSSVLAKQMALDGLTISFFRLWIGLALTGVILAASRYRPRTRDFKLAAPAGVAFGANMVLGLTSLKVTTVADATLINAMQPALVLLVAGSWFGERIGVGQVAWTVASIAGIAILIAGASSSPEWSLLGDALALAGTIIFTGYFLASKRILETVTNSAFVAGVHFGAVVVITPIALIHGIHPLDISGGDLSLVAGMACFSGVGAHMIVNWAHPYVRISVSSTLILLTPVVASLGAWVVLGESLNGIQLIGGTITLVAIAALTRTSAHEEIEDALLEVPESVP